MNWRGITLLSTPGKIIAMVTLMHLTLACFCFNSRQALGEDDPAVSKHSSLDRQEEKMGRGRKTEMKLCSLICI